MVPLWWDFGTLADLAKWKAERLRLGATPDAPFVASLRPGLGTRLLSRHTLRRRFRTACKVLGPRTTRNADHSPRGGTHSSRTLYAVTARLLK